MSRDPSLFARTTSGASHGRALLLVLLSGLLALTFGAGIAVAGPPPGQNTLFFSPSSSGGCGDGQISAIGEASAPAQSGVNPFAVTSSTSPVIYPPPATGLGTASGLYAASMVSTAWNYSFGYPWSVDGPTGYWGTAGPTWSTLVYFTNSCSGTQQYLYAACYAAWPQVTPSQAPLIGCPKAQIPGVMGPPESTPPWAAVSFEGLNVVVGSGLAMDATRGILYFSTVPAGCDGAKLCQVSIWSAPVATSWGGTLTPTLLAQLPNNLNSSHMAVDPISNRLFLLGANMSQVISIPTSGGGSPSVVLSGGSLISSGVQGLVVDPATAMVYVLSAQTGDEPNQIAQVPETGCCATSLFSGGAVGNSSEATALAIDPANGFLAWANSPSGHPAGLANTISWGPLDGSNSTAIGWFGAPDASYAAYVQAMTIAGGVGTCEGSDNGSTFSYTCPVTSVAAAGTTATASSSGSVAIPVTAYVVGGTGAGATSKASMQVSTGRVTGPMTVTVRDRRRAGRSVRTYATLRPGFSVAPNTRLVRRVTLPASALPSLRRGDLEVQVRTRPAGPGQRWRTRVLRVVRR